MTKKSERRVWPVEDKERAVKMHLEGGKTVAQVATEIGANESLVWAWLRRVRAGEPLENKKSGPPKGAKRAKKGSGGAGKRDGSYWRRKVAEGELTTDKPASGHLTVLPAALRAPNDEVRRLREENERLRRAIAALLSV